jgi:4-amino-4-deoxy-L-arabinose transferase-like glycosyltransferase
VARAGNRDVFFWAAALAVIGGFAAMNAGRLALPYFWDELAVYAPAALHMHEHGLSLAPAAVPVDLSRGHPLLCAFVFGLGFRLLGPTPWAGHVVALGLACATLVATFALGRAVAGRAVGLLGGLVLALQPLFIAQAALVLPEMLLACCCTAALWAHVTNRRGPYLVLASLGLLTKETAIVVPAGLAAAELASGVLEGGLTQERLRRLAFALAPLTVFAAFLAVQRLQNGWFVFPYHTQLVATSPWAVLDRARFYLEFALVRQGRFAWLAVFAVAAIAAWRRSELAARAGRRAGLHARVAAWLRQRPAAVALLGFAAAGFAFSVVNFPLGRYLLLLLPALSVFAARAACASWRAHPLLGGLAIAAILASPVAFRESPAFAFDEDTSYRHAVDTQRQVSEYLTDTVKVSPGTRIVADYPLDLGFRDPRLGYSTAAFSNVAKCTATFDESAELYIYASPGSLDYCSVFRDRLELVREFRSGFSSVLVFRPR